VWTFVAWGIFIDRRNGISAWHWGARASGTPRGATKFGVVKTGKFWKPELIFFSSLFDAIPGPNLQLWPIIWFTADAFDDAPVVNKRKPTNPVTFVPFVFISYCIRVLFKNRFTSVRRGREPELPRFKFPTSSIGLASVTMPFSRGINFFLTPPWQLKQKWVHE
jgi:hypothetical protein